MPEESKKEFSHELTIDELPKYDNSHRFDNPPKEYKPFEPKAKEDKVAYKRRKEKWDSQEEVTDISHRRFNTTLHPKQIMTSFKRCVAANEIDKENLMTCYRVVLGKLLADPTLSDNEFISLYKVIQSRSNEVYARRSKRLKRIR